MLARLGAWVGARPGLAVSLILAALGTAGLVFGALTFPWPSAPTPTPNLRINPTSSMRITYVDIEIIELGENRFDLRVQVTVSNGPDEDHQLRRGDYATFNVGLPTGMKPVEAHDCAMTFHTTNSTWLMVSEEIPLSGVEGGPTAVCTMTVEGRAYGFYQLGTDVVVRLPEISAGSKSNPPNIAVTFPAPDATALRWLANEPGSITADTATWNYVLRFKESLATPDWMKASAINTLAVQQQQYRSFLSGVALAVGTGALLMIIPELIHEYARRRDEKEADDAAKLARFHALNRKRWWELWRRDA